MLFIFAFMNQEKPFISIVIPAYNEERRIGKTLQAVDAYLSKKSWTSEIVVVSDGSSDGTVNIVEGYQKLTKRIRLIANKENYGKGYGVRQGMTEAYGSLRLFTDADNATPIEEVEKLLPWINLTQENKFNVPENRGGYDVVIGSIGLKQSAVEKKEPIFRVLAGKGANVLIQLLILPGIHDTQRGFKLFTASAAEKIFPLCRIDKWGFDMEALALAFKFKFKVKEEGIRWIHDSESKVKASAYFKTLIELFKIRLWLWMGVYNK